MQAATPSKELMASALRDRGVNFDAKLTQAVDNRLTLDEVISTPVHIEVVNLLVKLVSISKNTIVGCLHVEAEDSTAECSHPR